MRHSLLVILASVALASPAAAGVTAAGEGGFVVHNEALVAATPDAAWAAVLHPGEWWNPEHSYGGAGANMTLEPVAGGCFCETIPATAMGGAAGSVEHMRVVYIDPRVRTVRLRGSLGPLQGEALTGTLTMRVEVSDSGSKITWDYVVGGYARFSLEDLAPIVDGVVGEQLARLADRLGLP